MTHCLRGHDGPREDRSVCTECRRIRQRGDRFRLTKNRRRRQLASAADAARIQEVLNTWQS